MIGCLCVYLSVCLLVGVCDLVMLGCMLVVDVPACLVGPLLGWLLGCVCDWMIAMCDCLCVSVCAIAWLCAFGLVVRRFVRIGLCMVGCGLAMLFVCMRLFVRWMVGWFVCLYVCLFACLFACVLV